MGFTTLHKVSLFNRHTDFYINFRDLLGVKFFLIATDHIHDMFGAKILVKLHNINKNGTTLVISSSLLLYRIQRVSIPVL